MAKLYSVTDRIQVSVECGTCTRAIRASGLTFAEVQEKLATHVARDGEIAPIMIDDGPATCWACLEGHIEGEEPGRDEGVRDDEEV